MRSCFNLLYLTFFVSLNSFFPDKAFSQESLIETALKARQSIVTVKARTTIAHKSPKASAAIDPQSGRMIVAQRVRAARFEQNGAGVIINPSGLIVTNLHIVRGAQKLGVRLFDNTSVGAKIVHLMPKHDLALIKIDPPYPLTPIEFVDSNTAQLGDQVINIGSSELLKETISGGRIIGLGTSTLSGDQNRKNVELIKVNMNLYKGDSGGPLLDKQGRFIGMIAAKLQHTDRAVFAIPSNKIKILYLDFVN